jgi:hypothetical protein
MTHTLTDEQLGELLELMADADSVELKVTVPDSDQYSVAAALGMDPLEAQIRQVYFFDTPDLSLNRYGVVLRARRVQDKSGDCAVKLRPLTPRTLSKRESKSSRCGGHPRAMTRAGWSSSGHGCVTSDVPHYRRLVRLTIMEPWGALRPGGGLRSTGP